MPPPLDLLTRGGIDDETQKILQRPDPSSTMPGTAPPAPLAQIAQRNLNLQQRSIDAVNAVRARTPIQGTTTDSTIELGTTSSAPPSYFSARPASNPDDLIDSAIQNKRAELDARKGELLDEFRNAPLQTRYGKDMRDRALHEYSLLEATDRTLLHDQYSRSRERLSEVAQQTKQLREFGLAKAGAEFMEYVNKISPQRGTPEYEEAIAKGLAQNPSWIAAIKGSKALSSFAEADVKLHEDVLGIMDKLQKRFPDMKVRSVNVGTEGITNVGLGEPQKSETKIDPLVTDLHKDYGLTPDDFLAAKDGRRVNIDEKTRAVTRSDNGSVIQFDTPRGQVNMDYDDYAKYKRAFGKSGDEKVVVSDKDGKQFRIPKSQLPDAIKQGYKAQ